MTKLLDHIKALQNYIPHYKIENSNISNASVGWQIHHSLLVIESVCKALQKSIPADFKSLFSIYKLLIFTFGKIPRGKRKAPKRVIPLQESNATALNELATTCINLVTDVNELAKNHFFTHPALGNLQVNNAIKFLEIHTNHHLKIIKDILK